MRSLSLILAMLATGVADAADAKQRPNVVFVLIDDLRWDGLGCTGHPFVKTPNIDRLAREGATLRNAFVTIPLCSPSRASFMTGQFAHAHGVTDNTDHAALSHRLVIWPRLLHDAGYRTAYVGKWHMGTDDSPRPGFDRWVSFKGQGVFDNPPLNVDGKAVKATGYMTDLLNKHAVDFVKAGAGDKPFALCLAHKAVHGPFTPADRHKDLYTGDKFPPPASATDDRADKPALRESATKVAPGKAKAAAAPPTPGGPKGQFGTMRSQMRCVASIDEGVGDLLRALEETKQLDNTFFVFTSDNGYFWGEHGGLSDKRWAYEESIRIPFIVRYPAAAKAGSKVDGMALSIDVAPTALELAGVKVPAGMTGRSLLPLLKGEGGWRTAIASEYFFEKGFPRTPTWRAVRTDRWKYIRYPDNASWDELYDLKADPHERKNLIADPSAAEALKTMRAELDRQFAGQK